MKTSNPMVSVALMSYNQKDYIRQAMDCILAQQCDYSFEVIVGDDGSVDGTREIALEYQEKHPGIVKVLPKGPNQKVLKNFRDTVKACKGKYVAVCHSDDFWHDPLKLQKQISFLENNPEYGVVHTDAHFLLTSNNALIEDYNSKNQTNVFDGDIFEALIAYRFFLNTLTVIFKKSLFDEHVDIDKYIQAGFTYEDLPTWLELAAHTKFKYLPDSTATYRIMQESISRSKDPVKRLNFLKNHYLIKKYFIRKYNVRKEIEQEFEVNYHMKKFQMAFKWRHYPDVAESFSFLKEQQKANTKMQFQKWSLRYPFLLSTLKKFKKLYIPKTSVSQI
ncbi:MAG TPA: glycosyltransferase [Chitinophagaceae bacterium]|nr:glycosyltransferase [Chitinophagaceae bacterium]